MGKKSRLKKTLASNVATEAPISFIEKYRSRLHITIIVVFFFIALSVRLNFSIGPLEENRGGFGGFGDSFVYHSLAYSILGGNGFALAINNDNFSIPKPRPQTELTLTAVRGPVYPLFLSIVYRFMGVSLDKLSPQTWHINWQRVRIAQCTLDACTCILVFFIVKVLCPRSFYAPVVSSFIYIFSFYNIFYTRALLSETLTTFLVTIALFFTISALKKGSLPLFFSSGIAAAAIALCRPEYILFIPAFGCFILWNDRSNIPSGIKRAFIYILAALMMILPWSIRNYTLFKKPIPISSGGAGEGIYFGTININQTNWKGWEAIPDDGSMDSTERAKISVLHSKYFNILNSGNMTAISAIDNEYLRAAGNRIMLHPFRSIGNWVYKIPRLFFQNYIPKYGLSEAKGWFFLVYFFFAMYAFVTSPPETKIIMTPVILLMIYLTFILMPMEVEPRYSVAIIPGLICLSGIGITRLFSFNRR